MSASLPTLLLLLPVAVLSLALLALMARENAAILHCMPCSCPCSAKTQKAQLGVFRTVDGASHRTMKSLVACSQCGLSFHPDPSMIS